MEELLEILSTPYQLTEYREDWPNGKKGCLFYIPEIEEFEHGLGTICLIDAWWRKDDEIGLYNELHQCEWELAAENCIIRGYGAFLIRLGWIERNFEAVPERWELYCKWEDEVKKLPWHHPMERIAEECDNWLRRDDDVLQAYLQDKVDSGSFMYLTIRDTIRYTVKQVIDEIPTMMWKMQPVIKWDLENNGYGSWATYYHEVDSMMSEGRDYVELGGFRASMLNYFAAHYLCQKVLDEEDENKAAEWMRNGFYHIDDDVEHTITLNDIPFVFNGLDIEAVYECYRTVREEKIITRLKKEFKFAYCSDEEKKEQILHEMLFYESLWISDDDIRFLNHMSEETKDHLHRLIFHYMLSLILQYNGTAQEEDRDIMFECFPKEMELITLTAKNEQYKVEAENSGQVVVPQEEEVPTIAPLEDTFTVTYRRKPDYTKLIDFLVEEKQNASDADWARHALVIYEHTPTVLRDRPSTFVKWLKNFCEIFGRPYKSSYEPGKLKKHKKSKAEKYMPL